MQAALENLLKNEEAKREELEEIQIQQEELLRREKEMLIVLENARRLRDEEYHVSVSCLGWPVPPRVPKLFIFLVRTLHTSDLGFSEISSDLYFMLVLRCFM